MSLDVAGLRSHGGLAIGVLCVVALPHTAHAWAIGSQLNESGCHETITAAALRTVRTSFDTAPVLTPSRDEAALIADVEFAAPADFLHDLAGMTLLLGVRDNDLKGIDPLSSLDLIQVHGNPTTQGEHCIRGPDDDDAAGNRSAIAACRTFIAKTATEALDGLDASGKVDAAQRVPFTLYLGLRGSVTVSLPVFYVKMGAAMHALEDGFPHTYRTPDGMQITVVLNWIDVVGKTYDEARDGPTHRSELDRCWADDPTIHRNYQLATKAATDLLRVALDPALSRAQKIAQFDAVTATYLTFKPGCTFDNHWCSPAEATVTNSLTTGCSSGSGSGALAGALACLGLVHLVRRRNRLRGMGAVLGLTFALATTARAGEPAPPAAGTTAAIAPAAAGADPGATGAQEPGRDIETPTVQKLAVVREAKQLGSPWGFAASIGGAVDRPAGVTSIGGRYRFTETWIVGLDVSWNPWVTTSPMRVRAGVATVAGALIRRFPMKFDRVNLRSSLHAGTSTLLFDVNGAPKYSTGPYVAFSPLGLDYDLGNTVRIVFDPMEMALPMPLLGQLPLYYEQFRFLIGIQIGS